MVTETINSAVPQKGAMPNVDSRAWQAAKDFEAMFTSMMFKAMRGTVSEGSVIPKNMGEKVFTEMLDNEYARMNAEKGTLGLAALIAKEIERSQEKNFPGLDKNIPLWAMEKRANSSRGHSGSDSAALIDRVQSKWSGLISEASKRYGVDENLVTAVIARESAGNPRAVSSKGAKGLMQLMDGTARDMGVSYSFSPAENINGGVKYLKSMLDMFGGDEKLALASYNAGPGAVKKHNGIPPYRETQDYVVAVARLKARAAQMSGAAAAGADGDQPINGNGNEPLKTVGADGNRPADSEAR
jgi:Rod binding domain-containing protein